MLERTLRGLGSHVGGPQTPAPPDHFQTRTSDLLPGGHPPLRVYLVPGGHRWKTFYVLCHSNTYHVIRITYCVRQKEIWLHNNNTLPNLLCDTLYVICITYYEICHLGTRLLSCHSLLKKKEFFIKNMENGKKTKANFWNIFLQGTWQNVWEIAKTLAMNRTRERTCSQPLHFPTK